MCCSIQSCPDVLCRCLQVTEEAVVEAIQTFELTTVKEVRRHTGAGDGCMCCHARIRECLQQTSSAPRLIAR